MAINLIYDRAAKRREATQQQQFKQQLEARENALFQQNRQAENRLSQQARQFSQQMDYRARQDAERQSQWQQQFDLMEERYLQGQENWQAQFDQQAEQLAFERQKAGLERTITPVLDQNGGIQPRLVDAPASMAYATEVEGLQNQFLGLDALTELSTDVGTLGSEYTGDKVKRIRGNINKSRIEYAQAKGLGALAGPDLELVAGPIPDFTTLGANVSGVLRNVPNPVSGLDALAGWLTGKEGGYLGFTPRDQIHGFQEAYRVAADEIGSKIVSRIQKNPLLLDQITDAQLRKIRPELLAPLEPYLQARGRDPYGAN